MKRRTLSGLTKGDITAKRVKTMFRIGGFVEAAAPEQREGMSSGCDASLWNHVCNPGRLEVKEQCVGVTGTIEFVWRKRDGDYHIRLKPDPQYANLVNNERNVSEQAGCSS